MVLLFGEFTNVETGLKVSGFEKGTRFVIAWFDGAVSQKIHSSIDMGFNITGMRLWMCRISFCGDVVITV